MHIVVPQERSASLLNAAVTAAGRGWPVLPLEPGGVHPAAQGTCACPPGGHCWEGHATTDLNEVRRTWSLKPYNVALAPGPAGLVIVELAAGSTADGASSFRALCARHGMDVPVTRTVRDESGTTHLYFTAPAALRFPHIDRLVPGVAVHGWGSYAVAAGSVTEGGTWATVGPALINPLPRWLTGLLLELMRPTR